jgi:hypothetical protein
MLNMRADRVPEIGKHRKYEIFEAVQRKSEKLFHCPKHLFLFFMGVAEVPLEASATHKL